MCVGSSLRSTQPTGYRARLALKQRGIGAAYDKQDRRHDRHRGRGQAEAVAQGRGARASRPPARRRDAGGYPVSSRCRGEGARGRGRSASGHPARRGGEVLRGKMEYALIWSDAALADLDQIEAYIAARSPMNARRVVERFFKISRDQCHFPFSAQMIPEFNDPTRRETFVYEYRLMFCVEGDRI